MSVLYVRLGGRSGAVWPEEFRPVPDQPPDESQPSPTPAPGPPPVPPRDTWPTATPQQQHPWVWAHHVRPPRDHSTTTLVLSIIAALVGGIVIGGATVGLVWAIQADRDASPAPAEIDEQADELPLAEDVLPDVLDEIMDFIEEERGLEFTDDVDVQFLTDSEFAEAWFAPPPGYEPPDGPTDYGATYTALGLTSSPDDYYAAEQGAPVGSIMGYYDPWTDELVVRGTVWTPMVEGTVVHELTHALQDQHFDVDETIAGTDPDADLAARALIEGDASRVELAYYDAQDSAWRTAYDEGYEDLYDEVIASGPYDPLLEMLGAMPYWLGQTAVDELASQGNSGVDTALRNPPTTTAEVTQITGFVSGELPQAEEVPDAPPAPAGAEILDEGTLGVAFLELLHLDVQTDWFMNDYLAVWRGDRYVTWVEGDGACTSLVVKVAVTGLKTTETYFAPWADRTGGTVERLDDQSGVLLTSCAEW